jgi:predicted deacylase
LKVVIGSASAEAGAKSQGFIEISRSSAGLPIAIPVFVVNGVEHGPTLVASAAMHGTEIIGTMTLSRFFRKADPKMLKGTLIGVPVINTWAFEAEHRVPTLLDHFDLARQFPGDPDGSISSMIAHAYMNELARRADCLIDFHGQDHFWQPTKASIVAHPQPQGPLKEGVYEKCIELSKIFGVRQIWRSTNALRVTEVIMREKDIPAIGLEFGGVTDFRCIEGYVEDATSGLTNVLRWLGMLEGEIQSRKHKTCICDLNRVNNHYGGIWSTCAEVQDEVTEGTVVGTVSDPFTAEVLEDVKTPISGVIASLWCSPVIKPAVGPLAVGKVLEYV